MGTVLVVAIFAMNISLSILVGMLVVYLNNRYYPKIQYVNEIKNVEVIEFQPRIKYTVDTRSLFDLTKEPTEPTEVTVVQN
jgi:hypothetical protein